MHMADALITPAVGGAMWVASGATAVYCARKIREERDESKIPLMGVMGAFVFAAQMLNFQIPGTGSSGHLGGGLMLAILLGPEAAFLVMASILGVQALFFADGGLLALGANIFNLGFFPAFVGYPIYRAIAGRASNDAARWRAPMAAVVAAVIGLQLGAFGVVTQTTLSGISELPFMTFVLAMLPIHLAIGLVEGLVTAGVVTFIRSAQPELLSRIDTRSSLRGLDLKRVLVSFLVAALVAGVALSWFASANPDGLEWSIARVTGAEELEAESGAHSTAAALQKRVAFLPDYALPEVEGASADAEGEGSAPAWPAVDAGTSLSGVVGGGITLAVAALIGWLLYRRGRTVASA